MKKAIGLQLVIYSVLLAAVSSPAYALAPALTRPTLYAGLAGGVLCLVWGIRAMMGNRGKALPILTLIVVSFVLLSQAVLGWGSGSEAVSEHRSAAALITLLLLVSVGMLMRIAYAGVVFDGRATNPPADRTAKSKATANPPAQAHAGKRL
jgi:lysylphosphatidylglycerol synthetase-like protein (DUF2156 family)